RTAHRGRRCPHRIAGRTRCCPRRRGPRGRGPETEERPELPPPGRGPGAPRGRGPGRARGSGTRPSPGSDVHIVLGASEERGPASDEPDLHPEVPGATQCVLNAGDHVPDVLGLLVQRVLDGRCRIGAVLPVLELAGEVLTGLSARVIGPEL